MYRMPRFVGSHAVVCRSFAGGPFSNSTPFSVIPSVMLKLLPLFVFSSLLMATTLPAAPSYVYIIAPPSQVDGKPYHVIAKPGGRSGLDWDAITLLLEPQQQPHRMQLRPARSLDLTHLAQWVASRPEGNRNAGLFWAANRALDADQAADLSPLAVAARQAGLGDKEIARTLDSARRTGEHHADRQAEAGELT